MKAEKILIIRVIISLIIFTISLFIPDIWYLELTLSLIAYLIIGYDVLLEALKNICHGQVFDENFLMIVATIAAFATQQFSEGVMVMVLFQIGEGFQRYAVNKSRKSITDLMDITPDYANKEVDGTITVVDPDTLEVGDIIVIKAGERIPVDGKVIEGSSNLDTKSLTGESNLRYVDIGDEVLSGCINKTGLLRVEVLKEFEDSTAAKILELVENASEGKAKTENFITKFARYYTPTVVIAALLLAIVPPLFLGTEYFSEYIQRAAAFLVISCPCALVISVPLSFFGGIGGASKLGILVKGSNYLELLSKTSKVVFDKTGTLTRGNFKVTMIEGINASQNEVIKYAAFAEYYSNHPIAKAILEAYKDKVDEAKITDYKEISGEGISYTYDGEEVLVGNYKLLDKHELSFHHENLAGTVIYVSKNNVYLGYLLIEDEIKNEAYDLISDLKALHVKKTIMLSGDNENVAKSVAAKLNLDEAYANLLPEDKVNKLKENLDKNSVLAYVGDGINDAPVLMQADVGIAMGALGSDAAIEAADIVIMDDNIKKVATSISLAKRVMLIVYENIIFALGIKFAVLILGAFGLASMWLAIFADVGVAMLAILNAMRALYVKKFR